MDLCWSDELATHHHEIDEHHRFIIKVLNRLRLANAGAPRDLGRLAAIMTSLARLLQLHFQFEEVLLEQCGYPQRQDIADDHAYTLARLESMRAALGRNEDVSFRQISLFAYSLFVHLRQEAAFAQYIGTGAHGLAKLARGLPAGVPLGGIESAKPKLAARPSDGAKVAPVMAEFGLAGGVDPRINWV